MSEHVSLLGMGMDSGVDLHEGAARLVAERKAGDKYGRFSQ